MQKGEYFLLRVTQTAKRWLEVYQLLVAQNNRGFLRRGLMSGDCHPESVLRLHGEGR